MSTNYFINADTFKNITMLRIGTPRSSQISLTQGMSSNKEALSIAFMNLPQNGKGMLFIFAEKERK